MRDASGMTFDCPMNTALPSASILEPGILTSIWLVHDLTCDDPHVGDHFVAVDYAVELQFSESAPLEISFSEGAYDLVTIEYARPSESLNERKLNGADFGKLGALIGKRVSSVCVVDDATAEIMFDDVVCRVVGGQWDGIGSFLSPVDHFDCLFVAVVSRKS